MEVLRSPTSQFEDGTRRFYSRSTVSSSPSSMMPGQSSLVREREEEDNLAKAAALMNRLLLVPKPVITEKMCRFFVKDGCMRVFLKNISLADIDTNTSVPRIKRQRLHKDLRIPSIKAMELVTKPTRPFKEVLHVKAYESAMELLNTFKPESIGNLVDAKKCLEMLLLVNPDDTVLAIIDSQMFPVFFDLMETPAVVNLILLLLSKSEPTTEHMRTQWLDYLRKIKFVDLIISRITSSDPVHVNQMFMFCLRLVELMMRHDAIVSTWLFHDLLDTEEQFDKIMTCALSGSSLAAKRSADLLHIMFQKSVSAWDRLTELTVGNEPASLYVEMMADAFCSFASHGKKWVTAIGEFLACTRKEKMGEAVVLSHHTVHKPLTVTRQAVLELLCDFLQSDAMLIDSIPHSAWATMTNWFFELRYNSIYLVRFCYVLSIGIRMNREKILRWVLSGCKFLTRMINHFNEINLTEARGCIIDLCNTLRLKSESLNPRNFLPQLLTGHSLWRDFSKKMMELTVEFTKKKFFPITHNRDRFKRPSADALEQEDEETGLGSSYATKLGLGDLTPFVRPSRKRKSRSKVEERGNDDSINLCIPIAEEDEARMDEEFFHRLDKDMLDFLALSQSALMGSGNEGDDEEEEEEEEEEEDDQDENLFGIHMQLPRQLHDVQDDEDDEESNEEDGEGDDDYDEGEYVEEVDILTMATLDEDEENEEEEIGENDENGIDLLSLALREDGEEEEEKENPGGLRMTDLVLPSPFQNVIITRRSKMFDPREFTMEDRKKVLSPDRKSLPFKEVNS